jgi:hypothetical protein
MLNPDFRDMLLCLRDESVEYMVVGAYALAAHGFVRATGDIDIWVRSSPENARKVLQALRKFGAPTSNLSEQDFMAPDIVVQIGAAPCRVDILIGIDGVEFSEAWENKVAVVVDGIEIHMPLSHTPAQEYLARHCHKHGLQIKGSPTFEIMGSHLKPSMTLNGNPRLSIDSAAKPVIRFVSDENKDSPARRAA